MPIPILRAYPFTMGSGSSDFLLRHLEQGLRVIYDAPAAAVVLIVLGAIPAILWERRRVSILNERLKSKDDELTRYKEKLKGATPEEVKTEIEELRSRVVAQDTQIAELEKKLKSIAGLTHYNLVR